MATIKDQGPKLAEAVVAGFEANLGSPLPRAYRRFLLSSNGGVPVPNTVDVPGFSQSPTDVQEFFGLDLETDTSCIDWNTDALKERLDPRLVPIACDSGGNVFCLSLRLADELAVTYCDLEAVYGDPGKAPPEHPVAADFDQFLGRLRSF